MSRKYIYYCLVVIMGSVVVSGLLNSQLVIVNNTAATPGAFGWELILTGWGALLYAVSSIYFAQASDRFGRLPCITVAAFIILSVHVMMGWKLLGEYEIWHLFVYWGIVNLCIAVFFTGVEGLLSDYQDHSMPLSRRLGWYCISWSSGSGLGLIATGYCKQWFGPAVVFQGVSLLLFMVFIVTVSELLRHGTRMLGDDEVGEADIRKDAPFYARLARLGLFFGVLAHASFASSFPRFGRDFHGLMEGQIGNLLGTMILMAFVTFIWFPRWTGWHYNGRLQIGLQALMPLGFLTALLAPSGNIAVLRAGFIIFGTGYGMCYFFSIFYSLLVPKGHSKSGGIHESFIGLGKLAGPFAAVGVIWGVKTLLPVPEEKLGLAALSLSVISLVASIILQGALLRRHLLAQE